MISLALGRDLERFLRRLEAAPDLYSQIVICTPFVDVATQERLFRLAASAEKAGCSVRVITSEASLRLFRAYNLVCSDSAGTRRLVGSSRLHAKVYLALARNRKDSLLLLTSANLTRAGLTRNMELGVILRGDDSQAADLIEKVRATLEAWAAMPGRAIWRK